MCFRNIGLESPFQSCIKLVGVVSTSFIVSRVVMLLRASKTAPNGIGCFSRNQSRLGLTLLCGAAAVVIPQQALAQGNASDVEASSSEIIVTARKREESVQDVPATLNVLSGDAIAEQGIEQLKELQFAVPGFYVQNYETRATIMTCSL